MFVDCSVYLAIGIRAVFGLRQRLLSVRCLRSMFGLRQHLLSVCCLLSVFGLRQRFCCQSASSTGPSLRGEKGGAWGQVTCCLCVRASSAFAVSSDSLVSVCYSPFRLSVLVVYAVSLLKLY